MELKRGLLVRSKAGHDKHGFFVVLSADAESAVVCDGKRRTLEKPKKKNCRHLAVTNIVAPEEAMETNRQIRRAIRSLVEADARSSN